jgi:septum site-determining protein MinC
VTVSPALPLSQSSGSKAAATPRRPEAFDLKGTMASFTMLRLRSIDVGLVEQQLRAKVAKLPSIFLDAPVLVDLSGLGDQALSLSLDELVRALRACKLVPVAAANIPDELRGAVAAAGLGVWRPPVAPRGRASEETEPAETTAPEPSTASPATPPAAFASALARPPHTGPVVVTKPVRGGQVIHARDNDLVVLAPVNPGAQVIADGHLHIYATLRGRAVAGAAGLPGARIFCQKLEAELVAIAGAYVMAEEIPTELRGRAAQVFFEDGECRITAL